MNIVNPHIHSEADDVLDPPTQSAGTKLTAEILPACSLLGIIAGFIGFVAFGQAILPAVIAALIGALFGLFFACDEEPSQGSPTSSRGRK